MNSRAIDAQHDGEVDRRPHRVWGGGAGRDRRSSGWEKSSTRKASTVGSVEQKWHVGAGRDKGWGRKGVQQARHAWDIPTVLY